MKTTTLPASPAPCPRLAPRLAPRRRQAAACLLAVLLGGCANTDPVVGGGTPEAAIARADWPFAENAVILELVTDPKLNEYGGEAHTLLLGVFQLSDAAAFRKQLTNPSTLAKALERGEAGEGVEHFSRHVLEPGQRATLLLPRAQNARYVAVSAGYYQLRPQSTVRLFEIPLKIESSGIFRRTYVAKPEPLALRIELGAEGIANAVTLKPEQIERHQRPSESPGARLDPN